jgi:hypothetical protein
MELVKGNKEMINLTGNSITSVETTFDGETATTTTDVLFVSKVSLDFKANALYATIQRGTMVNGTFQSNFAPLMVTVNPDSSFVSSDGSWQGDLPPGTVAQLMAALAGQFDSFILSSGAVTGSEATS